MDTKTGSADSATVFTIGHSVAPADKLMEVLKSAGIETLVDVRSAPYSRRAPQANRESLSQLLSESGIGYVYLGDALGGLSASHRKANPGARLNVEERSRSPEFLCGIERLVQFALARQTCIMCAEEDPARCHRSRLIAPVLANGGHVVRHLRHDGSVEPHETVERRISGGQLPLF